MLIVWILSKLPYSTLDVPEALAVLPSSAGLAFAVLPGRWRISGPGSSAHSTRIKGRKASGKAKTVDS
jgi:hypothetical protein